MHEPKHERKKCYDDDRVFWHCAQVVSLHTLRIPGVFADGSFGAGDGLSSNIRTPVKYVPGGTNVSGNACYIWTAPEN